MRTPTFRLAFAALTLAALAVPARADLITTSMDTSTPIMTFDIPSKGVNGESAYVGPNRISFDGSPQVDAYCTDLFRSIGINDQYAVHVGSLSSLSNGDLVAKLLTVEAKLGDASALEQAALQLAIWDVVEAGRAGLGSSVDPLGFSPKKTDSGLHHLDVYSDKKKSHLLFGLSSSSLVVVDDHGSGVLNRMDALISAAEAYAGPVGDVVYIVPSTDYGQGFVRLRSVPEPSSLILSFIGLSGFAGYRLRRRLRPA